MLQSGKLGHTQTSMTVTTAWYQIHPNLIIILSQQLLLLDVQNASGEYKTTILSFLLATHALRCLRNQQFLQIMAIKPHKVTPISRMAVFSTPEDCLHIGEQPADQYKALFLESVWRSCMTKFHLLWKNRQHSKIYGNETPSQPGY